jgi:hypothetical protein
MPFKFDRVYYLESEPSQYQLIALGVRQVHTTWEGKATEFLQYLTTNPVSFSHQIRGHVVSESQGVITVLDEARSTSEPFHWKFTPLTLDNWRPLMPEGTLPFLKTDSDLQFFYREQFLYPWWKEHPEI